MPIIRNSKVFGGTSSGNNAPVICVPVIQPSKLINPLPLVSIVGAEATAQAAQTVTVAAKETFSGAEAGSQQHQSVIVAARETFVGAPNTQQHQTVAAVAKETFAGSAGSVQQAHQVESVAVLETFIAGEADTQQHQTVAASGFLPTVGALTAAQAVQTVASVADVPVFIDPAALVPYAGAGGKRSRSRGKKGAAIKIIPSAISGAHKSATSFNRSLGAAGGQEHSGGAATFRTGHHSNVSHAVMIDTELEEIACLLMSA